ncbi:hypothetical protein JCM19239_6727 [Vibrio variabilis]|uniref:Uncharacterized protein n=1 Tax=Vibrio variabilis TaxID=990271 RepID=A0ABQ0JLC9_9VIBR|nr:hypothetical protein JCM19239_6727 [Vibrio variabilis]
MILDKIFAIPYGVVGLSECERRGGVMADKFVVFLVLAIDASSKNSRL